MAGQYNVTRHVDEKPVGKAGASVSIDMPRAYDQRYWIIELFGTIHVESIGGSGDNVKTTAHGVASQISNIEVRANGRQSIFNVPFTYLVLGRHEDYGVGGTDQSMTTINGLGDGSNVVAGVTYDVKAVGFIQFDTVDGERPKDSSLATNQMNMFQLIATWGNPADLFALDSDPVTVTRDLTMRVSISETVELVDPKTGTRSYPQLLRKVTAIHQPVNATNRAQQIVLPTSNSMKSITVMAMDENGNYADGIVTELAAKSGLDTRFQVAADTMLLDNRAKYGNRLPGVITLDFTRVDGPARLADCWNLTSQAQPVLELGVVNNTAQPRYVDVICVEYLALGSGM